MTTEEIQAQLQAQREQLAGFESQRADLDREQAELQGQKQTLAVQALIENDAKAAAKLKQASVRLFEIGQGLESLDFATSEIKLRIAASEKILQAAEKRAIAGEVVELIKAQSKDALRFEKCLGDACKWLDGIQDRAIVLNGKIRLIDPELANHSSSKLMAGRIEERLTAYFKAFGARELVAVRDTPLPDQLSQGLHYFEGLVENS